MTNKIDLTALLSPTSIQSFVQSTWAKAPLLLRAGAKDRFAGVLDLARFEFLATSVPSPGWLSFVGGAFRPPTRDQLTTDQTMNMAAIIKALNAAIETALADASLRENFTKNSLEAMGGAPEALGTLAQADSEKYARLVKELKITAGAG